MPLAHFRHSPYLPSWATRLYSAAPLAGRVIANAPSAFVSTLNRVSPVSEFPEPVRAGATVAPPTGLPAGSSTFPVIFTAGSATTVTAPMSGFRSKVSPSKFRCQPVFGSSIVFRSHSSSPAPTTSGRARPTRPGT